MTKLVSRITHWLYVYVGLSWATLLSVNLAFGISLSKQILFGLLFVVTPILLLVTLVSFFLFHILVDVGREATVNINNKEALLKVQIWATANLCAFVLVTSTVGVLLNHKHDIMAIFFSVSFILSSIWMLTKWKDEKLKIVL